MITKREAAIIGAYTGALLGDFADLKKYMEEILGREIVHQEFTWFAEELKEEIREKAKADFINIKVEGEKNEN